MPGYLFYPAADAMQDRIFDTTAKLWGREQAERYIRGLHAHLEKLSETSGQWRPLPSQIPLPSKIKQSIYVSRYERHLLFFRKLPSGKIGVMSILHERMDIPDRLLKQILNNWQDDPD